MDGSDDKFGEMYGGMSIVDKVKLIAAWAPLLGKLEDIAKAKTAQDWALAVVAALRVGADKTLTERDNHVLDKIEALLRTPEGKVLAEWLAAIVRGAA